MSGKNTASVHTLSHSELTNLLFTGMILPGKGVEHGQGHSSSERCGRAVGILLPAGKITLAETAPPASQGKIHKVQPRCIFTGLGCCILYPLNKGGYKIQLQPCTKIRKNTTQVQDTTITTSRQLGCLFRSGCIQLSHPVRRRSSALKNHSQPGCMCSYVRLLR